MPQTRWLVFRYDTVGLFSLKMSRATSTAGKTLLVPTPYAIKMAFIDAALCHRLTDDPDAMTVILRRVDVRIGVPGHACVTGTIQSVRQETREFDRRRDPTLPPYRSTIAMREFVHYRGALRVAFDLEALGEEFIRLLAATAPAINYFGKRGSFVQFTGQSELIQLDDSFAAPTPNESAVETVPGQRAILDDFGPKANFDALNSFSATRIEPGVHRKFVETQIPLREYNAGPGFVHFCALGIVP